MLTFLTVFGSVTKMGLQKLQPNTALQLIENSFNIYHDYKRIRSITCAVSIIVVGAVGATLFVAEPTVASYLEPVITSALPFLGSVGTKILSGGLGFWIGGGVGFNVAKYGSRIVSKQVNGHTNTAYSMSNESISEIICNNNLYYPETKHENKDHEENIKELKDFLLHARDKLTNHKSNPAIHYSYKMALLEALRESNLEPLIELYRAAIDKRKQRTVSVNNRMEYMTDGKQLKKAKMTIINVSGKSSDDDSASESASESVVVEMPTVNEHINIHAHWKRYAKIITHNKTKPVIGDTDNHGGKLLDPKEKVPLLNLYNEAKKVQKEEFDKEMNIIPKKLKSTIIDMYQTVSSRSNSKSLKLTRV